jgi:hypothetical protein
MNTEILEAACEEFLGDTEDPTSEIYYDLHKSICFKKNRVIRF